MTCFPQYRLHGLVVESTLPLPALVPCTEPTQPDAIIRLGPTPASLPRPRKRGVCFEAGDGELLIWKSGVARFLVSNGREIVVELAENAAVSEIQRLLLSSPVAALLLQRGYFPLQASAVAHHRGAVLFVAGPALGKSTLAMACRDQGMNLLADDLATLLPDPDGGWLVTPRHPAITLWPSSLQRFGLDPETFPQVRPELEKRTVACPDSFEPRPQPLLAVYFLRRRDIAAGTRLVTPLPAAQGLGLLLAHTCRFPFAVGLGVHANLFRQATALSRSIRLRHATEPLKGFRVSDLVREILEDIGP